MATTKQALVASEHTAGLQATIFNMDIRAFGKDFDQYYGRAKSKENIEYIKSMPSRVIQVPGSRDVRLRYVDAHFKPVERDLTFVLAVGLDPKPEISGHGAFGDRAQRVRFLQNNRFTAETSRRRIRGRRLQGRTSRGRDPASAAASMSMELLASAHNTHSKAYPLGTMWATTASDRRLRLPLQDQHRRHCRCER
jgi:heterodisulfide reductase subunit A